MRSSTISTVTASAASAAAATLRIHYFDRYSREIEKDEERGGYNLSAMGLDSYGPMILMKVWGETWVARDNRRNFEFIHPSGKPVKPVAVCSSCRKPIHARDVAYVCNYEPPE